MKSYADFETGTTRAVGTRHSRTMEWEPITVPRGVASVGSWWRQAQCHGTNPQSKAELLTMCRVCPVQLECLAEALQLESPRQRHGVRGGLRPASRERLYAFYRSLD